MYVLGFDIGGTKCAVVLGQVTKEQVVFPDRFQTATCSDWMQMLDLLAEHGAAMLKRHGVSRDDCRIGISCGGPLSPDRRLILSPPNLPGWNEVPVVDYLEQKLGMVVHMENDADACALAEWKYGAGRGSQNMIFLTFGTGLGAGLILGGRLYKGACGLAGEVGHIRLAEDGPVGYGKFGSFEGFCSGGGIRNLAARYAAEKFAVGTRVGFVDWEKLCQSVQGEQLEEQLSAQLTAKSLALAAERQDADALEVFRISGRYFGRGLSILIDLLNPEVIVAGSIFARSGKLLETTMLQEIRKEALPQSAAACEIRPAVLGEQIGDYGSVMAGMEN